MEYFATKPIEELGPELEKRKNAYYEHLKKSGRMSLYRRIFDNYYKAIRSGGRVYYTGEEAEFINLDVADFRNILLHLHVLTTSQRPAFEPKAINTDRKSQSQVIIASGLLDYYLRKKKLDRYMDRATEMALMYGDGFASLDWNATGGSEFAVDDQGGFVQDGDVEAGAYGPVDIIQDYTRQSPMGHDWRMRRDFYSKWLVAAKYAKGDQQLYDRITALNFDEKTRDTSLQNYSPEKTDIIPVYTWYHEKNEAVPQGRMVKFLTGRTTLSDGPLPFDEVPLYRIAAAELDGTPFGYTIAFDLLPIQETIDRLSSVITTNQGTFGVSNILLPEGCNMTVSALADGLNALFYNAKVGKPEALNLTSTPAEVFKWIEMLRDFMQTISGVNSVARGEVDSDLSGAAMALIQSMAIQFNSGLQASYAALAQDMGTGLISILKTYAKSKRVAMIAGKTSQSYMKEWTGADLSNISHVLVDLGNPLMKTTAGRVNMADKLLDSGKIKDGAQYIQVLTTGKLEPIYEGEQAELMNIRSENERLSDGISVQAVMTDNPALHIQEHKCVIASPEARENPEVLKVTLAHLQDHINVWNSTPPALLQLMGFPMPPMPPAMPPPGPSGLPMVPPPGPGAPELPPEAAAAKVGLPSMPKNPLTGQKFSSGLPQ